MAQLKDSIVSGSLRVTDTILTDTVQAKILKAPTTSNGTTYGPGTSGQVLLTNGTSIYWGAASSISGASDFVTLTGAQTISGAKTFSAANTFSGTNTFSGANGFTYSGIAAGTDNSDRPVWFSYNGVIGRPVYDNDFKYNPSTNTLTVGKITGSLNHKLTIGSIEFDGSQDKTVPIYDGSIT